MRRLFNALISITLILILTACEIAPQVRAEERLFPNLSLEFLGEYQLPKQDFKNTPVGGLSALTYNRKNNRFYAISDDRSQKAPARFYTLDIQLNSNKGIDKIIVKNVTFIKNEQGKNYPPNTSDTEGIAFSPRDTVFIASEGITSKKIAPWIKEFDLKTGEIKENIPLPKRFLANPSNQLDAPLQGVQDNLGFESLTLNPNSLIKEDPFRLFTATESALLQDNPPKKPQESAKIRFLHYVINPLGSPVLIAEHLYLLDKAKSDSLYNGLCELMALEKEGYWLSLERTFSLSGFGAKIFQVVNSGATDTSHLLSLPKSLENLQPLRKKLLLDLSTLNIDLDNLEGMSFGPNLSDGSRTLILVSDDNFQPKQITQFLIFRLGKK